MLTPGSISLAEWRNIYRGGEVTLDPACFTAIEASAAAVERIVAKGEPVYGINTGFGKLASVRIADADLAALQRNIVLSHAAGVGEPYREPPFLDRERDPEGALVARHVEMVGLEQIVDRDSPFLLDVGIALQDRSLVELDVDDARLAHAALLAGAA